MSMLNVDDVQIELIKKRIKRINLHVAPGRVWMSVPQRVTLREAEAFARAHLDWIRQQQQLRAPREQIADRAYVWGESVLLRFAVGRGQPSLQDGTLTLFAQQNASEMDKRAALDTFYRAELARVLPAACSHWEAVTGLQANEYRVRSMKTRWGSCSLRPRRIWLNVRLAAYPPEALDYVLTHELTHLLVPNHSASFWALMDKFYPTWRNVRTQLRAKTP